MTNFGKTKWVPHTCICKFEGRHPQQWSIWAADKCDGCAARALQGDKYSEPTWSPDDLASAIAEIRMYGSFRALQITPQPQDVERVARIVKLVEQIETASS